MAAKKKQLNSLIDARLVSQLEELKAKTRIPKSALIETAIQLLLKKYYTINYDEQNSDVNPKVMSIVRDAAKEYNYTLKKLAE